jgi:hypothetical protein
MPHLIHSHILKIGSSHSSRGIYVFGAKIYKDKKTHKIKFPCYIKQINIFVSFESILRKLLSNGMKN